MSFGPSRGYTAKAKAMIRLETAPFFCGSEPAREAGDALCLANRSDAFASRLAPTADWRRPRSRHQTGLPHNSTCARPSVRELVSFGQSRGYTAKAKAMIRPETAPFFCGSEPACEAGDALCLANRSDAFASRLAPTADWRRPRSRHQTGHPHNSLCARPSVRGARIVWTIAWLYSRSQSNDQT